MCTSISYRRADHYFGRNLDVDFSFREQVVVTPRNFLFPLKNGQQYRNRFALIGMAAVCDNYPLYYEAANESGLAMAGLNFPWLAKYQKPRHEAGIDDICVFEIIPWILGQASSVMEARQLLARLNLTDLPFSGEMPTSPLHFMLSDRTGSIVVEPTAEGLNIFEDPFDVMTNNPPFPYHHWNMQQYLNLSPQNKENQFSPSYPLDNYAVGMGAVGLPGDASSTSRFVRAAFNLTNSHSSDEETDCVTQFFHVLDSVAMVKGATVTDSGKDDITLYSCCINTDKKIYYYKTYGNNQITAIRLDHCDLDSSALTVYDLVKDQQFRFEN